MAREFVKASTQSLVAGSSPVSAAPLSFSFWAFPTDDDATTQTPFVITNNSTSGNWWHATFVLDAPDNRANFEARNVATAASMVVANSRINAWNHLAMVSAATNDHRGYLNNVKVTDTTDVTPSNVNDIALGHEKSGGVGSEWYSGLVAEVGIWNVALTDAEIALLSIGWSPLLVRRGNLVFYAPLTYRSQDFDIVGNLNMTAYNSPSWAEHPSGLTYPEPAHPMIKEQLPYFWTLPIAEEEPEALSVQLDTLSAVFSAEAIAVSGGTEFPFSDDFTGSNNDPWNSTKWTAVAG